MRKKRRLLPAMLGCLLAAASAQAAGWTSPDGFTDSTGDWTTETKMYDGSTSSYASDNSRVTGYGSFVELSISGGITCNSIRINADWDATYVNSCDIDVYRDGGWVDVYDGAIANASWDEYTFTSGTVTAARIRYNYKVNWIIFWVYEFEFYEEAASISTPTCSSSAATSVEENTAILHGTVTDDGGEPCEWRFQYGTTTAYGTNTTWTGSKSTDDVFSKLVTGLSNSTTYHFRAQVRNSAGIASGADQQFTTGPPGTGWISPTGHTDAAAAWDDEIDTYDDYTGSYTKSYHNIGDPQWSEYINLTHASITADGLRFYARGPTADTYYVDQVDVDVYVDGGWTDVYQGSFTDKTWQEYSFTEGTVTEARIRFRVNNTNAGLYFELYEFDFHRVATVNIGGTCDGSTPVTLAVNGATRGTYNGASPYSFSTSLGEGDTILVYYNNDAAGSDGAVVTNATGSDQTDLDLTASTLIVRSDYTTMTNAAIADGYLSDTDIPFTVSGDDVTVSSGIALQIPSGETYSLGGDALTLNGNFVNSGTFTHANGSTTFAGTTTVSGSSTTTFNNVTISGTLTAPSGTMNVAGNFANNGTFTHNSGTVAFTGTTTVSGSSTTTFNNVTISGALTAPSGTMNVAGNFANNGTFTHNSGTVAFTGTTTVSGSSITTFNNVTISSTLTGHATNMNVNGNWANSGTYTHNSGEVTLVGSGTVTLSGSTTFNDLTCTTAGKQINFTAGTTQTVNGTLDLAGASGNLILLRSTASPTKWAITLPNGAQNVAYVSVQDSDANTNTVTVSGGTDAGNNNANWVFASDRYWIGGTGNWSDTSHWSTSSGGAGGASVPTSALLAYFDSNSGTGTCTVNQAVNVAGLVLDTGNSITLSQGSNTITVGATGFEQKAGTFTGGTTTIDINGDWTLTGGTFTSTSGNLQVNGDFDHSGGTFTHNSGTVVFDGTSTMPGSQTTSFSALTVSGTLTAPSAMNVAGTFTRSGTFNHNDGTITFNGTSTVSANTTLSGVTISGTLTAPAGILYVEGDFANNGTFTHNSGTVQFAGTSTVSGSSTTTFNNVTVAGSSTLTGHASSMSVAGNWTNNGTFNHNSGAVTFSGTTTVGGSSISIFDNVTISGTLTAPSGSMRIVGDFVNNGTFNNNSGTLVFNGTGTVSGSSTTSFANVTIWGALTGASGTMNVAGDWDNDGTYTHNSGTVQINGGASQTLQGSVATTFNALTVTNSSTAAVSADITVSGTLTVDNGSTVSVANGDTLTLSSSNTLNGGLTLLTGSTLAVGNGLTQTLSTNSTVTVNAGSTITNSGAGTFSLKFAGDVTLDGDSGNEVVIRYADLELSGATGKTAVAEYVKMYDIGTGGTYLTISGNAWDQYIFTGWGFEDVGVAGGEISVRIESGDAVLFTNYVTSGEGLTWLYGDSTDEDRGDNGSSGAVNWSPTSAMVAEFDGTWTDAGVCLTWATVAEKKNVGFRVYRAEVATKKTSCPSFGSRTPGKAYTLLNVTIIPGATGSVERQEYSFTDALAQPGKKYAYALMHVDIAGRSYRSLKPILVDPSATVVSNRSQLKGLAPVSRDLGLAVIQPPTDHDPACVQRLRRVRKMPFAYVGPVARIETQAAGLYRLDKAALADLGFDLSKRFVLLSRGRTYPLWVVPDGEETDLCFYAAEYRTRYSDRNVFWLYQANARSASLPQLTTFKKSKPGPADYEATSHYEVNTYYRSTLPDAGREEDHWFCPVVLFGGRSTSISLTCSAVQADKPSTVQLMLRSYATSDPSTHFIVLVNGIEVGEYSWDGARRYLVEADIPAGTLVDGTNTVTLSSFGDTPAIREADFLDWAQITYRRRFEAEADSLAFTLDTGKNVTVSGLSEDLFVIADVTNSRAPKRITKTQVHPGGEGYEVEWRGRLGRSYALSTVSALQNPPVLELTDPPLYPEALRCEYLIVCADPLKDAAQAFAAYHADKQVEIVTVSEAMDATNHGLYDPAAIETLVRKTQAKYLLLLGDMTYDFFSVHSDSLAYCVPGRLITIQDYESTTDYTYATRGSWTGKARVAVGRIPARTVEQALAVLGKIQAQGTLSGAVLVAGPEETLFKEACERAAVHVRGDVTRAYIADVGLAQARSDLFAGWNAGKDLIYYVGHGAAHQWGVETLFVTQDVNNLATQTKQPIVIQLDCLSSGVHMHPTTSGYSCLAESLLFTPGKGARAVIGSVGFSEPVSQADLGAWTLKFLKKNKPIGEALRRARLRLVNQGGDPDVLHSFILLGDPASN